MIRINLLGISKSKSKHGAAAAAGVSMDAGSLSSPFMKIAAALAVAALLNLGYWYKLDRQAKTIVAQMEQAEQKNRELAEVKAHYLERQKEAQNYKHRVDVIDQLRAGQTGPVDLLSTVGSTVDGTEAVWLNTMKDQGPSVDIEGMALSTDAVANLISNLQATGYFRNIEIKETFQDDSIKEMQAFQFVLSCEKGNPKTDAKAASKS